MYDFVSWGRIISLTMDMYLCKSFFSMFEVIDSSG